MKVVGIYRKCDLVTLLGLIFSITGIVFAYLDNVMFAMIALILAAICDAFDGVVARKHKYTDKQKTYGTELDSLADVVSFAILPMLIVISLSKSYIYTYIASGIYVVCSVIRLAYFNTLSITKEDNPKEFIGFPVPTIVFILPILYFVLTTIKVNIDYIIYPSLLIVMSLLYILPFKIKKFTTREKIFISVLGILVIGLTILKKYLFKY